MVSIYDKMKNYEDEKENFKDEDAQIERYLKFLDIDPDTLHVKLTELLKKIYNKEWLDINANTSINMLLLTLENITNPEKLKQIAVKINEQGGFDALQGMYYSVRAIFFNCSIKPSLYYNGIGEWID